MSLSRLSWALAAAALLAAAPAAHAAEKKADAPAITAEQMARGKKEAPALVQAAGARCTVKDAAYRGSGKGAGGKNEDVYEVSCDEGLGYLILNVAGAPKPTAYDCLAAAGGGTTCVLPANADPKAGLTQLATAAGRTCPVSAARYVGTSTSTGETFYEVACGAAPGFRLGVPSSPGAKPDATDCLALAGTSNACTLTTKQQSLASLTPLVQASGRTCQVSDGRLIGASEANKSTYYEVACSGAAGFVLATDTSTGKYKEAIDCARAQGLAGGCTLTSASVSNAAAIQRYTQLAGKAGFPCNVSKFRSIGESGGRDVVELACSNRPDGAIAVLSDTGHSEIYDCVRAGALKQTCQLSSPDVVYDKYSAALAAKGRGSCKVSNARYLGQSKTTGGDVVETACADGKPGWVAFFAAGPSPRVEQLLSCRQAANDGSACQLPTNLAGNGPTKG